jgi:hypothetical protein
VLVLGNTGTPADESASTEGAIPMIAWRPAHEHLTLEVANDSDDHSFAIDISDFQAHSFRDAQPSRVADGQNRAMLDIPYTTQKLQNLFGTGNNCQLLGFLGSWNDFRRAPILMQRDFVKETKSSYRDEDRTGSELPFVG